MNKLTTLALLTAISIFTVFSLSASEGTIANNLNHHHDDSLKYKSHNQYDSDFYTKESFAATFSGDSNVTAEIIDQSWAYFLDKNWSKLDELFTANKITSGGVIWPPANGGFNTIDSVYLKKGQMFDRYGSTYPVDYKSGVPNLSGSFTSPILKDRPYSFGQRSLNGDKKDYDFYFTIEVLQDLKFICQEANVIPWFEKPGLATQEKWIIPKNPNSGHPYSFTQLAEMGLIRITIVSSPSGKYPQLVGTVIEKKNAMIKEKKQIK
jgi:hypothetical protein